MTDEHHINLHLYFAYFRLYLFTQFMYKANQKDISYAVLVI